VALAAAVEQAVPDAQAEEAEEGRGGRQRGGFMKRIGQGLGAAGALAGGRGGAAAVAAQAGAVAGAGDAGGVAAAAALGGVLGGQAGIGALSEQATIAQLNQLVAVTPQIMRGVRVSELAQVKGCVWLTQ
jgi:hypothetical protein